MAHDLLPLRLKAEGKMNFKIIFLITSFIVWGTYAPAQYFCTDLFTEKPSLEKQWANLTENKKISVLQEIPIAETERIHLGSVENKKLSQFLVRFMDLQKYTFKEIDSSQLSTTSIDGIKHIAIQIFSQTDQTSFIKILNSNTIDLIQIKNNDLNLIWGFQIKHWTTKPLEIDQVEVQPATKNSPHYQVVQNKVSTQPHVLASLEFSLYSDTLDINFITTHFNYRNSYLSYILLKKFIDDHPQIKTVHAQLAATNRDVLHSEMILFMNPSLAPELLNYDSWKKTAVLYELTNKRSAEELREVVSQALKKTPLYKTLERLGYKNLAELDFSDLQSVSFNQSKP
jgi:hypothetical protein